MGSAAKEALKAEFPLESKGPLALKVKQEPKLLNKVPDHTPCKARLYDACQQKLKQAFDKDSICFVTEQQEDSKYVCQLACESFKKIYRTERTAATAKKAE